MRTTRVAILEVENLHSYYGRIRALNGISLSIEPREIVALIGANGAGKTTALKTISGLVRPQQGSIRLEGADITRAAAHEIVRRGILQCPEGRRIFRIIRQINREEGVSILLVEQNARIALALAHRTHVIERGEIKVSGTSKELSTDPEMQQAYLGGGHRKR